jgi:hypothetical protein
MVVFGYSHDSEDTFYRQDINESISFLLVYRDNKMVGYGVNVHETKSQSIQG